MLATEPTFNRILPAKLTKDTVKRCGMTMIELANAAGVVYSRLIRYISGGEDCLTPDEVTRVRRVLIVSRDRGYDEPLKVFTIEPRRE